MIRGAIAGLAAIDRTDSVAEALGTVGDYLLRVGDVAF
jgi:hypothetical protein